MAPDDDEGPWYRSLLMGLGALVGVAALVGGLVAAVALGAVSVTGLGDEHATVEAEPSLHIPERTPGADTGGEEENLTLEDLNGGVSPSGSAAPSAEASPGSGAATKRKRRPPRSVISLSASPVEVAPSERIYLSGTYPGGEGASLQVQRWEGGWNDFPTSASVSGGTFSTYIMTSKPGPNRFRVVDAATGKPSNEVSVTVR